MSKAKASNPPSGEYQNFEKLAKPLIAVPNDEIDKSVAEYQQQKSPRRSGRLYELSCRQSNLGLLVG